MALIPTLRSSLTLQVSLLGPGDCQRIESTVVSLRDRWRSPELGLATIGSPVYRNGESLDRYFAHAAEDVTRALLEHAPTQFQEYIQGVDVRLHWLRGECFPLQIQAASGVDYRFGEGENEFSEIEVPDEVARLCSAFCEGAGLELAGFDFKLDSAGEWVALEANPMPGFDYYDRRLDGVISRRLIEMLGAGPGRREPFIERRRRPPLSSPLPAE